MYERRRSEGISPSQEETDEDEDDKDKDEDEDEDEAEAEDEAEVEVGDDMMKDPLLRRFAQDADGVLSFFFTTARIKQWVKR